LATVFVSLLGIACDMVLALSAIPGSGVLKIERTELRFVSSEPDFSEMFVHPDFNVRFYEEALSLIQREAPVDNREVVEWMHECAASNVDLELSIEPHRPFYVQLTINRIEFV